MKTLVAPSLIFFIFLLVQANNKSSSPYAYWSKVFPNTSMPAAIKALLPPERFSEQERRYSRPTTHKDVIIIGPPPARRAYYRVWVSVEPDNHHPKPFLAHDQSNGTKLFFLEESLKPGCKINLTIVRPKQGPSFLPHEEAQVIPFSSAKLSSILRILSIKPGSRDAFFIRQTLLDCERPPIKGETKHCTTTLEAMISFAISELGTSNLRALCSSTVNEDFNIEAGVYRVRISRVKVISRKAVTCHNMLYPYAVLYCHKLPDTKLYMVSLIADDGDRMNAIALCHRDTSNWNPGHVSFQMLGIKPGTVPVCHFLGEGCAWVPN